MQWCQSCPKLTKSGTFKDQFQYILALQYGPIWLQLWHPWAKLWTAEGKGQSGCPRILSWMKYQSHGPGLSENLAEWWREVTPVAWNMASHACAGYQSSQAVRSGRWGFSAHHTSWGLLTRNQSRGLVASPGFTWYLRHKEQINKTNEDCFLPLVSYVTVNTCPGLMSQSLSGCWVSGIMLIRMKEVDE